MAHFLYDGYCYETLSDAARAATNVKYESSDNVITMTDQYAMVNEPAQNVRVYWRVLDMATNTTKTVYATRYFDTCPTVGSFTNQSFNPATLDTASVLAAFVAGAAMCFVPLSIAWAASFLLNLIHSD